jgi:Zn-dependent protease with chaperone function
MSLAFLGWNRACELSADRAGLLACGDVEKAVTALLKLVAGEAGADPRALAAAYRQVDAEDDTFLGNLNEAFGSHPMLIRRINELRSWAASNQYHRLAA